MLEASIRDLLIRQLHVLEDGLSLVKAEQYIPAISGTRSFIDILAQDRQSRWVLIEIKRSDAAAREAIHEVYKYVEAVKSHLGARDDEIRVFIVSTEWKELLSPFSRFVHDTSISALGFKIDVDEQEKSISADQIEALPINSGRVLSPWHEISFYSSHKRLTKGIASYDASCAAKSLNDYVMVEMKAPEGHYDTSVYATARELNRIRGVNEEPTAEEIEDTSNKMMRLDHLVYFVPQLLTADDYMRMIERGDVDNFEEAKELCDVLEGDELLNSLQGCALDAGPNVYRDHLEIGYPAKFQIKLLGDEGWTITRIHRRGAFARNRGLSDQTILDEIAGAAGTSGQRLKRSIALDDKAQFSQLLRDLDECLPNNPVWKQMLQQQLQEAKTEFPNGAVDLSVFAPSTGVFTLFFVVTMENGVLYCPNYGLLVREGTTSRRMYVGELMPVKDVPLDPDAFIRVLKKYYDGELGNMMMSLTWGGYEARDIDILDDLDLMYGSFRCDIVDDDRRFYRMKNGRWREVGQIRHFDALKSYFETNERLLRIVVNKISPRFGPIHDGSSADRQLENCVDPVCVGKNTHYVGPPDACDLCSIPLSSEKFMSDGQLREGRAWANMCADCTVYHGRGIGWGSGQLYRQEDDGSWLLVGGCNPNEYLEDE